MFKKVCVCVSSLTAFTAIADEGIQSTKKAALLTPIENMYGQVEVRQTSLQWKDSNGERENGISSYRLVPRLGTKAFRKKLDLFVETPIVMESRSSNYDQKVSNYQTTFAAYDDGMFSVTPYSKGYLPHKGSAFSSDIAINTDVAFKFPTTVGLFKFHGGIEPAVSTGTRPTATEARVVDRGTLALDQSGAPVKESKDQQEPTSTLEYIVGFAYYPSFAPKFNLIADAYFDRSYVPVYEVRKDESGESLTKTGYTIQDRTLTDIVVTYVADNETSIQSLTRIRHNGLYAEARGFEGTRVPHIEQRISLIQKLF